MARREHKLEQSLTADNPADGSAIEFDIVRIEDIRMNLPDRVMRVTTQCGRYVSGVWEAAGSRYCAHHEYVGDDFDTFRALASGEASEEHLAKLEDQIYKDMNSTDPKKIGDGTQQDAT